MLLSSQSKLLMNVNRGWFFRLYLDEMAMSFIFVSTIRIHHGKLYILFFTFMRRFFFSFFFIKKIPWNMDTVPFWTMYIIQLYQGSFHQSTFSTPTNKSSKLLINTIVYKACHVPNRLIVGCENTWVYVYFQGPLLRSHEDMKWWSQSCVASIESEKKNVHSFATKLQSQK
jgi:hypothetical protein